jgi:ParB-like chromosome segregation protein Spo0J
MSSSSDVMWDYEIHVLALIFPTLTGMEFDDLVESIRLNGLMNEIVLWEGKILDGRNRYLACKAAGITPRLREFTGSRADAVRFVCEQNLRRRHMTESQRAMAAQALIAEGLARKLASGLLRISRRSVSSAGAVVKHGHDTIQSLVRSGELAVSAAEKIVKSRPRSAQALIKTAEDAARITEELHGGATVIDKHLHKLKMAVRLLKDLAPRTDEVAARVDERELADLERTVKEADDVLNRIREELGSRRAALAVH